MSTMRSMIEPERREALEGAGFVWESWRAAYRHPETGVTIGYGAVRDTSTPQLRAWIADLSAETTHRAAEGAEPFSQIHARRHRQVPSCFREVGLKIGQLAGLALEVETLNETGERIDELLPLDRHRDHGVLLGEHEARLPQEPVRRAPRP